MWHSECQLCIGHSNRSRTSCLRRQNQCQAATLKSKSSSDEIHTGLHPTKFIVICARTSDGCSSHGRDSCELLIFRRAITGKRMINLKTTDVKYMRAVTNWYASISNLAPHTADRGGYNLSAYALAILVHI